MVRASLMPLVSLVAATSAGYLAVLAGLQLPWLLGPMVATAALSISGMDVFSAQWGRRTGQLVIGSTIGLNITHSVFVSLLSWAPAMVFSALVSILITAFVSVFYARLGRLDAKTAYFALAPGGLSEMAGNAAVLGAQPEPIALTQAMRVALIVILVPALVGYWSVAGTPPVQGDSQVLSPWLVPVVLIISMAGILVTQALRLSNPWMIGALVTIGLLSGTGLVEGHMPRYIFNAGQVLVGAVIGSRFKREAVLRLARLLLPATICILISTTLLIGYALVVAQWGGMAPGTLILAVSPGGLAEMSSTAQLLNLGVVLVTGFHVVRAIIVNSFAPQIHALLVSLKFFAAVGRLDRYLFGLK